MDPLTWFCVSCACVYHFVQRKLCHLVRFMDVVVELRERFGIESVGDICYLTPAEIRDTASENLSALPPILVTEIECVRLWLQLKERYVRRKPAHTVAEWARQWGLQAYETHLVNFASSISDLAFLVGG